jgi:hypothetical protein
VILALLGGRRKSIISYIILARNANGPNHGIFIKGVGYIFGRDSDATGQVRHTVIYHSFTWCTEYIGASFLIPKSLDVILNTNVFCPSTYMEASVRMSGK